MKLNETTKQEVLDFLGHGFRNIDLGKLKLTTDDLGDIASGLEQFYRNRKNAEASAMAD